MNDLNMFEKPKINLCDSENIDTYEEKINNDINKNKFKKLMDEYNINTSIFFTEKIPNLKESYIFNNFLKIIKQKHKVCLIDSILFLEEEFIYFKRIIRLLDEENMYDVKHELSEKFTSATVIKNNLSRFLCKQDRKKDGFAINKDSE